MMKCVWENVYRLMLLGCCATAAFCSPITMRAEGGILRVNRISVENGLSQPIIQAILQDQTGFMWFGTQKGLNKYNGYDFTVYMHDPKNTNSLAADMITVLYEDRTGILWIGTKEGGIHAFDPAAETFTRYWHDPKNREGLSHNEIRAIYEDRQGTLWIGTADGLNAFDSDRKSFTQYAHQPDNPGSLGHQTINAIYEDRRGVLWIGTAGGLSVFDRAAGSFRQYRFEPDNPQSLSSDTISSLCEDEDGNLWIGTLGGGLNKFDRSTDSFIRYSLSSDIAQQENADTVTALLRDSDGVFWIGTAEDGLRRFEPASEWITTYQHHPASPDSLSSNRILSLYQDQRGLIWAGTAEGLNTFDPHAMNTFMAHYTHDPQNSMGLSDNTVSAIYEDQQQIIWFGTMNGLNAFDRTTGTFTLYQNDPTDENSLSANGVACMYEDHQGRFWIGTWRGGLNRFDRKTGKFSHYLRYNKNPNELSDNTALTIAEDRDGMLWIGTFHGLNRFDPVTETFTHYFPEPDNPYSVSHLQIWTVYTDRQGDLWIGTWGGGLNRFDHPANRFVRYPIDETGERITAIYENQAGTLWFGGWQKGLIALNREDGTFTHYGEQNGLASDNVFGILEDHSGNLWLSTDNGLSKFDVRQSTFTNYDHQDGLQEDGFWGRASYKSVRGEMFFGGSQGVNAFYPDRVTTDENRPAPPIVLTAFQKIVNDQEVPQPFSLKTRKQLSAKESSFSFEFAVLDYAAPPKNSYAYILEGFDRIWQRVGAARTAKYTNIQPGEYRFRVKGADSHGVWSEVSTPFRLIIQPPWWQTWWAKNLFLLGITGIIAGMGYSIAQYHGKEHALHLAEKLRVLNEVGQTLTSRIGLQRQEILELIYQQANALMDTRNMYIAMYDPEHQELSFPLVAENGQRTQYPSRKAADESGKGGLTEEVIRLKRPLTISDVEHYCQAHNLRLPVKPIPKSWLGVPIILENTVIGVITLLNDEQENAYSADDVEVLQIMTDQAAIAIQNARFYSMRLEELYNAGLQVTSSLDVPKVLLSIATAVRALLDADSATIFPYNRHATHDKFGEGVRAADIEEHPVKPSDRGLGSELVKSLDPVFKTEADMTEEEKSVIDGQPVRSYAGIPLVAENECVGVLLISYFSSHPFSEDEKRLAQLFGLQAAIALNNARNYEEIKKIAKIRRWAELGQLAGSLAHRIGNKGGTIRLRAYELAETLNEKCPDAQELQETIETIVRNNQYLLDLSVLLFKPFRASEEHMVSSDMTLLLKSALNSADIPEEIELQVQLTETLPPVKANRFFVEVFLEVISNAVEAMQSSAKKVLTIHTAYDEEWLKFFFDDTGVGIAEDKQSKIFELFTMSEGQDQHRHFGFGLWWVRTFLRDIGGNIEVKSREGAGTSVIIYLPREEA